MLYWDPDGLDIVLLYRDPDGNSYRIDIEEDQIKKGEFGEDFEIKVGGEILIIPGAYIPFTRSADRRNWILNGGLAEWYFETGDLTKFDHVRFTNIAAALSVYGSFTFPAIASAATSEIFWGVAAGLSGGTGTALLFGNLGLGTSDALTGRNDTATFNSTVVNKVVPIQADILFGTAVAEGIPGFFRLRGSLPEYQPIVSGPPPVGPRKILLDGVPNRGKLIFDPTRKTWTSPEGLVYGRGSKHGNRVKHILDHTVPNPNKPVHSVFSADRTKVIGLIDEAWTRRVGPGTLQPNGNRVWIVEMGREIGTAGQTSIKIVILDGTKNVITAFPK